jgi:hypothetical protein
MRIVHIRHKHAETPHERLLFSAPILVFLEVMLVVYDCAMMVPGVVVGVEDARNEMEVHVVSYGKEILRQRITRSIVLSSSRSVAFDMQRPYP